MYLDGPVLLHCSYISHGIATSGAVIRKSIFSPYITAYIKVLIHYCRLS